MVLLLRLLSLLWVIRIQLCGIGLLGKRRHRHVSTTYGWDLERSSIDFYVVIALETISLVLFTISHNYRISSTTNTFGF